MGVVRDDSGSGVVMVAVVLVAVVGRGIKLLQQNEERGSGTSHKERTSV